MNLTGIKRGARLSVCGGYRFTLTREWDDRPRLVACMFNPSTADHTRDDPTVRLLTQVASHNGFGRLTVVNGIPLISAAPAEAAHMTNHWDRKQDWHFRDRLHQNLAEIQAQVAHAGAVLIAWGALADRCADWFDCVLEEIESARPDGVPLLCLGLTATGYPKHPLARGRHRVSRTAALVPYLRG